MNHIKFLKFLISDFEVSNSKYPTVRFFRSEVLLIYLWFVILEKHYLNEDTSMEDYYKILPDDLNISKPTFLKFLDNAVEKKYIIKVAYPNDKRKFLLKPSDLVIREFEVWSKGFSGF
tara:strand:+ start:171 stop:524 length:354 start_codon:yes stop_codon:yes gene_type:complete